MRRLFLVLPFALLAACGEPEQAVQARTFFAKVDSGKFDEAWQMLDPADQQAMDLPEFLEFYGDSSRLPGYDSILECKVVEQAGDSAVVVATRMAVDWDVIDRIKSRSSRRDLLDGLRESGDLPRVLDTLRRVTVVSTPQGPRFRLGLASAAAYRHVADSISQDLASKVRMKAKQAIIQNNYQAFFYVTGTVTNGSDLSLKPVVVQVWNKGKLTGTITVDGSHTVPAKGAYSDEMIAYYENGLTPQSFGTGWSRGAVLLSIPQLSFKVVKAQPADRAEFQATVTRLSGGAVPPVLF